ncbi:atrial natriuretic peptide receptor 2-like, partial [Amphibalanus amphitrite]|uniref:atrial natriuretic peptide receptor 2-like n=1 Tax=Amphibalanus amphitrite TaxID=1232801 RepID=UPI001C917B24
MLSAKKIDINRELLMELKRMKDLHHDHLVRFIGMSIESPHQAIFTEYCPKGSLQDILENEQIKLDWMFRYSLMHDIVKGMAYLHSSEIRVHSKLKSSNCVVDSRFVLKITDFGLHQLDTDDENQNLDSYVYWKRRLWTAPELLRTAQPMGHIRGTQKGDVYSFAIIVQEIIMRMGPFFVHNEISPKEIVENVRNGQKPPFRPAIDDDMADEEVLQMMRRCWSEDPVDRPDFHALKGIIRRLN